MADGDSPQEIKDNSRPVRLQMDNWKWHDVPFYPRLVKRVSEVVSQFRPVPYLALPPDIVPDIQSNRLISRIQPDEENDVKIQAQQPSSPRR